MTLLRRLWRLEQASSAKAAPMPEVLYKCRLASAPSRIGARRRTGARGRPVLLTVSANRLLLSDTIAGSSRAEELCSYRRKRGPPPFISRRLRLTSCCCAQCRKL